MQDSIAEVSLCSFYIDLSIFPQAQTGVFGSEKVTSQVSVSHMVDGRVVTGGEAGHLYIWEKARLISTVKDVHPVSPLEG